MINILKILFAVLLFSCPANAKDSDEKYGYWGEPPVVINCSSSPYSLEEVSASMRFWEELGYKFDIIIDKFNCSDSAVPGSITIDSPNKGFGVDRHGESKLYIDLKTKKMISIKIEILYSTDRVLAHELGHALGWKHFSYIGHIMNAYYESGGWETKGLKKINIL